MSGVPDRIPEGPIKLTYEDYVGLPNDGKRYEIFDGELSVTPSPVTRHQRVSRNLQRILDRHVVERRLGEVLYAPTDVILAPTTVVVPDLVFVRADRSAIITERAIEGPPDLIVEIVSPSSLRQDRVTKAALYARYEVAHYWIVDPEARTVEFYELENESYRLVTKAAGGETVEPSLLPGLRIDLGKVWA